MRFASFFQEITLFFGGAYTDSSRPSRQPESGGRAILWRRKGYCMQLDKKSLDRLLKLNDDQLRGVLGKLLAEYGVDVSRVPLGQMDMTALRAVLSAATEEDVARFLQMMGGTPGGGQR